MRSEIAWRFATPEELRRFPVPASPSQSLMPGTEFRIADRMGTFGLAPTVRFRGKPDVPKVAHGPYVPLPDPCADNKPGDRCRYEKTLSFRRPRAVAGTAQIYSFLGRIV